MKTLVLLLCLAAIYGGGWIALWQSEVRHERRTADLETRLQSGDPADLAEIADHDRQPQPRGGAR